MSIYELVKVVQVPTMVTGTQRWFIYIVEYNEIEMFNAKIDQHAGILTIAKLPLLSASAAIL